MAEPVVKEWIIDLEAPEPETHQEDRSGAAVVLLQPSIDMKDLFEDILVGKSLIIQRNSDKDLPSLPNVVDDGHDEESHMDSGSMMGSTSGGRDGGSSRCSCCGGGLRGPSFIKGTTSQIIPEIAVQGTGKRQPEFNRLVKTITNRFCAELRQLGLEPLPVTLRRRTVRETANLIHEKTNGHPSWLFKRSVDEEGERNGRSFSSALARVRATLSGLTNLRPVGDVRAFSLPQGRTLLKVNTMTGPVQIATDEKVTVVDELPGEMSFVLHPRGGGVTLHSFRFEKPSAELRTAAPEEASAFASVRSAPAVGQHLLMGSGEESTVGSGTQAAVTRLLRRALRVVLNTAR